MIEEQNYLDEYGNPPIVKKDDTGIRPAGKPDECFYCHSKVGEIILQSELHNHIILSATNPQKHPLLTTVGLGC